jgi:plasmid stability protein
MAPVRKRPPVPSERLTITLPFSVLEALRSCAAADGRSVSNEAAYVLARALSTPTPSTSTSGF